MSYIVNNEWLKQHLQDANLCIADCRFSLSDPAKGKAAYLESHISGAVYFDLEHDLSASVTVHGGRHPLPDFADLVDKLEQVGISNEKVVVAYDDGEGAFAARFWWLLSYLGHENVYVLDGGFSGWQQEKLPVTSDIPHPESATFTVNKREDWLVGMDEVKECVKTGNSDKYLIDSREEKRYLGIEEHIDKKAGHIPGAINKPWFEGLESGFYKSAQQQKQRFAEIDPTKEVIVYCGSGVTALPNFLALKEAGYEKVKLYAGSFSDWISYEDNVIEP